MLPENIKTLFVEHTTEALRLFPKTSGQCVALCAFISARLTESSIANRVALGSLSSNGRKTFQYKKPIPARPTASLVWDGHAWIEFEDGIIGEPSLLRTARMQPQGSNLRLNLEFHQLLDRGALLIRATDALKDYGLKYTQLSYLKDTAFLPLIDGLIVFNKTNA